MRVLVISPLFPPLAESEAICGGKFVQTLMDAGVDALVIYSSTVWRVPHDSSRRWESLSDVSVDIPNRRSSVLLRCSLGLRYRTLEWTAWTHAAVSEALRLHRERPFDLVVSRALPWNAH